jgi:hypothetical protein
MENMAAQGTRNGFNTLAVACGALAVVVFVYAVSLFLQGGWEAARRLEYEAKVYAPPNTALADAEAAQEAILDGGYRWVDQGAGRVGVPVERAVELIVARQGRLGDEGAR